MLATSTTDIHRLLQPETVRVGLPGRTKQEVLDATIDLLHGHPAVRDPEALREAVWARERVMSTGVGKGLALPHAKTPAVTQTIAALAITAEPVDFGAIDDLPVRILFLLVGTEEAKTQHIKVLSRISRLMNRAALREALLAAHDPDEVLRLIEEAEAALMEG
ncbi:MAG: PTS sugar transporter subunit IIA [Rhodothermaceae bacterium]|nr:MAG: PTS sugar transporter subunit IIA [Bacteroidota bacterium]GIV61367.1 MAG: PTS sugar transporter subunit IIA [Rhodothermaceae bacterium]